MTNEEIQQKLDEILLLTNTCDVIIALQDFNKEYKKSDFYKQTKMSLNDLLIMNKNLKPINIGKTFKEIQTQINELNLDNLNKVLDDFIESFQLSNIDLKETLKMFEGVGLTK